MSSMPSEYDYGACHVCGVPMEEQRVMQDFWLKGQLIVIDGVPAGVCPGCGERVVSADVARSVVDAIQDSERIEKAPRMSVPRITLNVEESKV